MGNKHQVTAIHVTAFYDGLGVNIRGLLFMMLAILCATNIRELLGMMLDMLKLWTQQDGCSRVSKSHLALDGELPPRMVWYSAILRRYCKLRCLQHVKIRAATYPHSAATYQHSAATYPHLCCNLSTLVL